MVHFENDITLISCFEIDGDMETPFEEEKMPN